MHIEESKYYDYDDVLLKPKRSELSSRKEVILERTFKFKYSKQEWTGIPIIASNMDTVGTFEMAKVLQKYKILTVLHKYYSLDDYKKNIKDLDKNYLVLCSGIDNDCEELYKIIDFVQPIFFCVDVPNGYSVKFLNYLKEFRKKYPTLTLIAGNVSTKEICQELVLSCGVDICKCGIGGGYFCDTRLKTGVGMPMLTMTIHCSEAVHALDAHMISDGGIRTPGCVAKAICAGADFVMIGSYFSGTFESYTNYYIDDKYFTKDKLYNNYKEILSSALLTKKVELESYGMSSTKAMIKYKGEVAEYRTSEGRDLRIKCKGSVENIVKDILGGLRSTGTYIGAKKLKNFGKCATFILVNKIVHH